MGWALGWVQGWVLGWVLGWVFDFVWPLGLAVLRSADLRRPSVSRLRRWGIIFTVTGVWNLMSSIL